MRSAEALAFVSICCLALAVVMLIGTGSFLIPAAIWFASILIATLAASLNTTGSKVPLWALIVSFAAPLLGALVMLVGMRAAYSPH